MLSGSLEPQALLAKAQSVNLDSHQRGPRFGVLGLECFSCSLNLILLRLETFTGHFEPSMCFERELDGTIPPDCQTRVPGSGSCLVGPGPFEAPRPEPVQAGGVCHALPDASRASLYDDMCQPCSAVLCWQVEESTMDQGNASDGASDGAGLCSESKTGGPEAHSKPGVQSA